MKVYPVDLRKQHTLFDFEGVLSSAELVDTDSSDLENVRTIVRVAQAERIARGD